MISAISNGKGIIEPLEPVVKTTPIPQTQQTQVPRGKLVLAIFKFF